MGVWNPGGRRVLTPTGPTTVPSVDPMALPRMTLLRHGESDWNLAARCQGQDDRARLTAEGLEQARAAAEVVAGLGVDLVVTSDLARARATAEVVCARLGLEALVDPLVRERSFGYLEGGPLAGVRPAESGIADGRVVDPDARPAGGESFRDVVVRARRFLEKAELVWAERHLLVVTHGGFVRAARAVQEASPLEGLAWYPVGNGSLWSLDPSAAADQV